MDLETASILFSALAIVVSLIAIATARKTAQRQTQLQERMVQIEVGRDRANRLAATKANITASVPNRAEPFWFVVRNDGPSEARAIAVAIDGVPSHVNTRLVPNQHVPEVLGPGMDFSLKFRRVDGLRRTVRVEIQWSDASGEPGRWSSELSI